MKKLRILIPSLVAAVAMPFTGLVSCKNKKPEPVEQITLTFVADPEEGGTVSKDSLKVDVGSKWKTVKTQVTETEAEGFDFDDWYVGTTKLTDDYPFNADTQIKAHFVPKTKYTISVINDPSEGFSITETEAEAETKQELHVTSTNFTMNSGTVDYITIGASAPITTGYTFVEDEVDALTGVLTIPAELVTGNIGVHFSDETTPIANDFETDTWQTVSYYANEGLAELCAAYNCQASDFIGKTRTIHMNENDYEVMVIGTNQDQYHADGESKDAALTFQFNNLISKKPSENAEEGYLTIDWNPTSENYDYWASNVETNLNSTVPVRWANDDNETQSVYSMATASDPNNLWTQHIKSTCRTINCADGDDWIPTEREVKFFLPTISNLYSYVGLSGPDSEVKQLADDYFAEGQKENDQTEVIKQYTYYNKNIGDDPVVIDHKYDCFVKKDCNNDEPYFMWLPSPRLNDIFSAFCIGDTVPFQPVFSWDYVNDELALAPCFCI